MIGLLITGGTLDKKYNPLTGELVLDTTQLATLPEQARCTLDIRTEVIMLKDSLDMDAQDREKILAHVRAAPEDRLIITHGTDTMVETGRLLAAQSTGKTIILTGAMIPYSFGHLSDALFNLGCACIAVQTLRAGVFISMNGRVFPVESVRKNHDKGIFELHPKEQ